MTLHMIDPIYQVRCVLCGGLFVAVDDEHDVRLSARDAQRLRMNAGDPICAHCWINDIAVDHLGRPAMFIGHA